MTKSLNFQRIFNLQFMFKIRKNHGEITDYVRSTCGDLVRYSLDNLYSELQWEIDNLLKQAVAPYQVEKLQEARDTISRHNLSPNNATRKFDLLKSGFTAAVNHAYDWQSFPGFRNGYDFMSTRYCK